MDKLNLDAEAEKVEITLKGKQYVLDYPEWGALKKIEELGEEIKSEEIEEFIHKCGMPVEAIKACTLKQLQAVYMRLAGVKKS